MEKAIVLLAVSAVLLSGCITPPVPGLNPEVISCGNDVECFKQAADNGEKASFVLEEEGAALTQTIQECGSEICVVKMKITKVPDNVPEEMKSLVLLAGEMSCTVGKNKLGEIPEDIEKCSGPLVEAMKSMIPE